MGETPTPDKPKRTRKARRNFSKELESLRSYAQVVIEVFEEQEPVSEFGKGKIAFAREILKRTEG